MNVFNLVTMIGGLALFLYGMKVMGDNLTKMAGSRLAGILEHLTKNPLKGVLLGLVVTAIIQSSSATTVMVVGFVNSGIMTLSQAVGVIMGANIGTTVTSWLLAMTGIQGDSFLIQLLKPTTFAPMLAFIGVAILMSAKENDDKASIASILIGLSVLLFGMETMSNAVAPLAELEGFRELLVTFSNPILGVIVGAIFTAIIQSSSASVGILQAFALTGTLSFSTAIPIIMGQNIGTCGTALISSIGASKNAKRAALVHLNFNMLGSIIFLIVFYGLHSFIDFDFMNEYCSPASIAVIHSLFNIASTVLLFPFAGFIEKVAKKMVPDEEADKPRVLSKRGSKVYLDERFLTRPSFALEICKKKASEMAVEVEKIVKLSLELIKNPYNKNNAKQIKFDEKLIDEYRDKLTEYLLKLSGKDLSTADTESLVIMQHTLTDLEEISDYAKALQKDAHKIFKKDLIFSNKMRADFEYLVNLVEEIVSKTTILLLTDDKNLAREIEGIEERIHKYKKSLKKHFLHQIQKGNLELELGIIFENMLIKLERTAAHCTNIAYTVIENEL